MPQNT